MIKIEYTNHLNLRLKIRKIPQDYPRIIYVSPEQKFFDNLEGNFIAIKRLKYNNKIRNMMIAYEKDIKENVEIITVHPISEEKILNRIMSGRWTKDE